MGMMQIMQYTLGPLPCSLSTLNGTPAKTDKKALLNILQKYSRPVTDISRPDCIILDGMAVMHSYSQSSPAITCANLTKRLLTLSGLGTWNFTSPRDWALFVDYFFNLLNQSFICHGSQFYSLFTKLQEHMSLWPQCNIYVLRHQVHDALNDITMMPPWCYNRGHISRVSISWLYPCDKSSYIRFVYHQYNAD